MVHGWLAIVDGCSVGRSREPVANGGGKVEVSEPVMRTVSVGDAHLTTAIWGDGVPDIVLLHDGLGSITQWRSVPAAIAARTGRSVLAYDRAGHGASTPVPNGAHPADWMTREADRLDGILEAVDATHPLVVGHSDGGTIALLHAIAHRRESRILLLAAHSWVEPAAVSEIRRLRGNSAAVIAGLARHHDHPVELFEAWSGAWTSDAFASFDIRDALAAIAVPVHVVQGDADEFATDAQAVETAAAIGESARCSLLPGVRHLIHHDDPDLIVELVEAEMTAM